MPQQQHVVLDAAAQRRKLSQILASYLGTKIRISESKISDTPSRKNSTKFYRLNISLI